MDTFGRSTRCLYLFLSIAVFCELIPSSNTLLCYHCMRLDCDDVESINPMLCSDIRDAITSQLREWYYFEESFPKCPDPKDVLQWKIMQIATSECSARKAEWATCALSRLQIFTELDDDVQITTYGTVMGCASLSLLNAIKQNIEFNGSSRCAIGSKNFTDPQKHLKFSYEVETCHTRTEYCSKDFCIEPLHSVVRPFKPQTRDNRFDAGVIIGIIALIVVIIAALILASYCRTPMSWASNSYHVSDQHVNIVSGEGTSI